MSEVIFSAGEEGAALNSPIEKEKLSEAVQAYEVENTEKVTATDFDVGLYSSDPKNDRQDDVNNNIEHDNTQAGAETISVKDHDDYATSVVGPTDGDTARDTQSQPIASRKGYENHNTESPVPQTPTMEDVLARLRHLEMELLATRRGRRLSGVSSVEAEPAPRREEKEGKDAEIKHEQVCSVVHKAELMSWRRFTRMNAEEKEGARHVLELCCEGPRKLETEPSSKGDISDLQPGVDLSQLDGAKIGHSKIERIRIFSRPVNDLLESLLELNEVEEKIPTYYSHLRPFKALLTAQQGLRERYETLLAQSTAEDAVESESDAELRHHLGIFLQFLDGLASPIVQRHQQLCSTTRLQDLNEIKFADLWSLFQPGRIVYEPRVRQAYLVVSTSGGRPILSVGRNDGGDEDTEQAVEGQVKAFIVEVVWLGFNGKEIGPLQGSSKILPFEGSKPISSLPMFPIEYENISARHAQDSSMPAAYLKAPTLLQALEERGKKFIELAMSGKPCHREYSGLTLQRVREQVDSQVIVDFDWFYRVKPDEAPELGMRGIGRSDWRDLRDKNLAICACTNPRCQVTRDDIFDDRFIDELITRRSSEEHKDILKWQTSQEELKQKYAFLLPRLVYAFVLRTRVWNPLDIDYIMAVQQNTDSFDQLVLPAEHKRIVEAVVRTHSVGVRPVEGVQGDDDSKYSDDLVRGKGRGFVILLHGVPGVGKTSTAETVAELTGRPLFALTCGDIGDDAQAVQNILDESFTLANRWGCVMLLDEADVFLQQRSRQDMKRNAIVSVFLRVLEYYSGILFLTTNRVGTFDEAFRSRIHVALYYKQLGRKQSISIWENNLKRLEKSRSHIKMDKEKLLDWAKKEWKQSKQQADQEDKPHRPWNGRQIHNACQTAAALAEFEAGEEKRRPEITTRELDAVAEATKEFDRYLLATHGLDDMDLAQRAQDRGDDQFSSPMVKPSRTKNKPKRRVVDDDEDDDDESDG